MHRLPLRPDVRCRAFKFVRIAIVRVVNGIWLLRGFDLFCDCFISILIVNILVRVFIVIILNNDSLVVMVFLFLLLSIPIFKILVCVLCILDHFGLIF